MLKGFTKEERSWIFYDWANSAYTMIVVSTIMSMYFMDVAIKDLGEVTANAYWGYANSFSTLILVLLSPILGTLADVWGMKKRFFNGFLWIGLASTVVLGLLSTTHWKWLLIIYVISALAYAGSNIFYDAFLVDVTEDSRMDVVSSLGYALGYIGSTIPFILAMVVVVLSQLGKLNISLNLAYRISFFITAIWWFVFSIPILKNVHQKHGIDPEPNQIRKTFSSLWMTLKDIKKDRTVFLFLLAYFFYIDGVDTIIKMATSYGVAIGLDKIALLGILLIVQFVAFPFAIIYGNLSKKFGNRRMLMVGILTYCVICVLAFFMSADKDKQTLTIMFFVLAIMVGTAQGGIQALSRSYFARIIPKHKSNQYFGFYNIFGKFAAILGPVLFGWVSQITGKVNIGVSSIILLFFVGAAIFRLVPDEREYLNQ